MSEPTLVVVCVAVAAAVVSRAVIVAVVWAVRRSRLCDDGKPHEWQVWVPAKCGYSWERWQSRECLKCNIKQRRRWAS